jgi:hypothetical protein
MKIKLADLELPQVQEITVYDRRALAEHKPPGMAGSLFQNLGRDPTGILVAGVVTGPQAFQFIEKLQRKFEAAKPVPFTAEIVAGAAIRQTLIADMRFQDLAGKPQRFAYALDLREFIKPSKAENQAALNAGIRSEGRKLANDLAAKLTKQK